MNSYGGKTELKFKYGYFLFESSVNSYGGKTIGCCGVMPVGLRVV